MAWQTQKNTPLADQAKREAQQAVQQGRQAASHVWDLARGQFHSQLTGQKERAATGLGDIAELIRQSGSQLAQQGHPGSSHYADLIADRIAQVAGTVHEKEVEELLADGRTRPRASGVFLSIAALLGFLLVRFLKSSSPTASAAA